MPAISIITVVRNAATTIGDCLTAVKSQTVRPEHIVVDGCSTDGTLELLESRQTDIGRLVSEPDQGMYDALNKGFRQASGEVVGVLHADDVYADDRVLAKVVEALEKTGADSCYGDLEYITAEPPEGSSQWSVVSRQKSVIRTDRTAEPQRSETRTQNSDLTTDHGPLTSEALTLDGWRVVRRWRAGGFRPEAFYWGWMPPHPTFFVRRSIYEKYGMFRLDLGTAADYELMLRFLLKHRISTTYIPDVLVRMRLGGKSTVSLGARLRANEKDRKAWYVNDLRPYPWTIPLKPLRKLPQFLRDGLLWRMLLNRGG